MKAWQELTHFGGFDWASDHHDLVIQNKDGLDVEKLRFSETLGGWQLFRQLAAKYPSLGVVIETSRGAVVERLLESGVTVYPINPKTASRYREGLRPSGATDDAYDARSMAACLRAHGMDWKALKPEDPLIQELRLLCRDEVELIQEQTAMVNRLTAALKEYYPAALEAFDDWTASSTWAFVIAFPTPQVLQASSKCKQRNFLHANQLYRPEMQQKRLEIFARATAFCGSAPTTAAKSRLAIATAKLLKMLHIQLLQYRARIADLFSKHPDSGLWASLPNCGPKLAPRLLTEIGDDRARFDDADSLQAYGGPGPVTEKSGKFVNIYMRRGCNKLLRHTLHLWADLSRKETPWAEMYYQAHRAKGCGHADALRRLAHRWLKIIWKMWQTKTCYDPELHQKNQLKHGSWILQLKPVSSAKTTP